MTSSHLFVLDARAARTCPVATQLKFDDSATGLEVESSPMQERIFKAGWDFEAKVFTLLGSLYAEHITYISAEPGEAAQAATLEAMASDARLILGGELPSSRTEHRTGRPDLLIRTVDGWFPGDVKNHTMTKKNDRASEVTSTLDEFLDGEWSKEIGVDATSKAHEDVLQLAHYWRQLETTEFCASQPQGLLIGSDLVCYWFDLERRDWKKGKSVLALYDEEFALRVAVAERQLERNSDPSLDRLVLPVQQTECAECPWRKVCRQELEDIDSLSLITRLDKDMTAVFASHGLTSRKDLADLDLRSALFFFGKNLQDKAPIDALLKRAEGCRADQPLEEIIDNEKTRDRCRWLNITTVGDLLGLDDRVRKLPTSGVGYLPNWIQEARAFAAGTCHLRFGTEKTSVRRADVEVDVDMESTPDLVYLWGNYVTGDVLEDQKGYVAFVDWEPLDLDREAALFAGFWQWLHALKRETESRGKTFAAYFWTSIETTMCKRIVEHPSLSSIRDEVLAFVEDNSVWIDLEAVVREQLVTGRGTSIKTIAPMTGFQWSAEDAGGANSIVWYESTFTETDPDVRDFWRDKLLEYNKNDVEAELRVRDWLEGNAFSRFEI